MGPSVSTKILPRIHTSTSAVLPQPLCLNQTMAALLSKELQALYDKGTIELAPEPSSFLSSIFLVCKKMGDFTSVINLGTFHEYVVYRHFKMEGVHLPRDLLQDGDWFTCLDLKDTYLTVPIHPNSRCFLRFTWLSPTWQFTSFPFGLRSVPWCFT